jgi:hypothetical protein
MRVQPVTEFSATDFDCVYPTGIERHFWTVARCRILADAINRLPDRGGKILEIGCGRGVVVGELRGAGLDCVGVELADDVPVPASLAEFVMTGVDATQLPSDFRGQIATVLLLDVIEHLPDPGAFVSSITGSYPAVRHLIVTVPARSELWSNYDEFCRHYRRYDLKALCETLVQAGFNVSRVGYFFHSLYPFMLMAKLGRGRATRLRAPGRWTALLHNIAADILYWESVFLPSALYGTSAIAIANKKSH